MYLGHKQESSAAIQHYRQAPVDKAGLAQEITAITQELARARTLQGFASLLEDHENLIAQALQLTRVQKSHFADYWGTIKSLGAWGGDFVLATSDRSEKETLQYFTKRDYSPCVPYAKMILSLTEDAEEGRAAAAHV